MKKSFFAVVMIATAFAAGCANRNIHGDKEVVASGGSRPAWVDDVNKQTQKEIANLLDHKKDPAEFYYAVSQASVDNEELLASCYEFARANAANDFARGIVEEVKGSTATASDGNQTSQYSEAIAMTKSKIVGSQVLAKYWETTLTKDQVKKTTCWIIAGISMPNYSKLKTLAEQAIADDGSKTKKKAKKAVQKKQDEETSEE